MIVLWLMMVLRGCRLTGSCRTGSRWGCGEFRDACRALSLAYVVIIPCHYRVTLAKDTVIRADQAIADAVPERRSRGNGTKGPAPATGPSSPPRARGNSC